MVVTDLARMRIVHTHCYAIATTDLAYKHICAYDRRHAAVTGKLTFGFHTIQAGKNQKYRRPRALRSTLRQRPFLAFAGRLRAAVSADRWPGALLRSAGS
eukprot:6206143-Pleurochrysis_carterae.AAC.1